MLNAKAEKHFTCPTTNTVVGDVDEVSYLVSSYFVKALSDETSGANEWISRQYQTIGMIYLATFNGCCACAGTSAAAPTLRPPSFLFTRHQRPTSLSKMNCQMTCTQLWWHGRSQ